MSSDYVIFDLWRSAAIISDFDSSGSSTLSTFTSVSYSFLFLEYIHFLLSLTGVSPYVNNLSGLFKSSSEPVFEMFWGKILILSLNSFWLLLSLSVRCYCTLLYACSSAIVSSYIGFIVATLRDRESCETSTSYSPCSLVLCEKLSVTLLSWSCPLILVGLKSKFDYN